VFQVGMSLRKLVTLQKQGKKIIIFFCFCFFKQHKIILFDRFVVEDTAIKFEF